MSNFVKIFCRPAMRYSGLISAVPTNEHLLTEKRTYAKLQDDTPTVEGLIRVYKYTERRA